LQRDVPRENATAFVRHTPANAVLRSALRFGGRIGHRFPQPARQVARGPLLTALRLRGLRPAPAANAAQRAALPHVVDDIARLERVTGTSYVDWAAIRPEDLGSVLPGNRRP
jgi:hypothetical protein